MTALEGLEKEMKKRSAEAGKGTDYTLLKKRIKF